MPPRLHDWFYDVIAAVCLDRDYLYLAFYRHFSALLADVTSRGGVTDRGEISFPGMKSGLQVCVTWQLARRLTWTGPNILTIQASIEAMGDGPGAAGLTGAGPGMIMTAQFDLSTGDEV